MARRDPGNKGGEPPTGGQPLDMSAVVERSRNMLNPELIMRWDSYMADLTALARRMLTQVAMETLGESVPLAYLELAELSPGSKDLVARPALEEGAATVEVRWVGKKLEPRIDLQKLILLGRFRIGYGMKASVPVIRPEGGDPGLIFQFSQACFAEIGKGKSRRRDSKNPGGSGRTNPKRQNRT